VVEAVELALLDLERTMKRKTGTREWSSSSVNIQRGCRHGCLYCYAQAQARRFGRVGDWTVEEVLPDALTRGYGKRQGTVMFPTTHDITPENVELCATVLEKLVRAGNQVLVVSKPWRRTIEALRERLYPWQEQITFRFTIGTLRDRLLALWEPHAPGILERLSALEQTYLGRWRTSISIEPALDGDPSDVLALVERVERQVTDTIWIGIMNHAEARLSLNGHGLPPELDHLIRDRPRIEQLYRLLARNTKVRWKDSIKAMLGLPEDSL